MGTLLISVWGDPSGWYFNRYIIVSNPSSSKESFTSLEPLYDSLKPEKVVIYAPDTLIEKAPKCMLVGSNDYPEVKNSVKRYIAKHVCSIPSSKVDIIIVPGVINKGNITVKGEPKDLYYIILYDMIKRIIQAHKQGIEYDIIALDASTGLNYMMNYALQAIREATAILGVLKGADATLKIYNSSPVIPSSEDFKKYCRRDGRNPCKPTNKDECRNLLRSNATEIHLISEEKLGKQNLNSDLNTLMKSIPHNERLNPQPVQYSQASNNNSPLSTLNASDKQAIEENTKEAIMITQLARLGLLPILTYELHDNCKKNNCNNSLHKKVEYTIGKILELWEKNIRVSITSSNKIVMHREAGLDKTFKSMLYTWAITYIYDSIVSQKGGDLTIGLAIELGERLYGINLNSNNPPETPIGVIQYNEIDRYNNSNINIINLISDKSKISICIRYLVRQESRFVNCCSSRSSSNAGCDKFKRDIIAHGGWGWEIVRLNVDSSTYRGKTVNSYKDLFYDLCIQDVCKDDNGNPLDLWDVIIRI